MFLCYKENDKILIEIIEITTFIFEPVVRKIRSTVVV